MRLTVKFADGRTEEVAPAPVDLVRFERHYKMAAGKIEEDQRIEYVMYLAWCALSRTGRINGADFDTFLEQLADIDDDEEVQSTGPPLPPPG